MMQLKIALKSLNYSQKNATINLLNKEFYSPLKIVKSFEEILNKKAFYKEKN